MPSHADDKPTAQSASDKAKAAVEAELDSALADSFPASDPVSLTTPDVGQGMPARDTGAVVFSNPDTIARPGGYSLVVNVKSPGRIIFLAGQLGFRSDGVLPESFSDQAFQAFENVRIALESVGASFKHVVKLNNFLVNIADDLGKYRAVRDQFVDLDNPPASTTIGVPALAVPGALYEVEALAILPE